MNIICFTSVLLFVYFPSGFIIAQNPECKYTKIGKEYNGTKTTTKAGITCQRWDSQTPHTHAYQELKNFPDKTIQDASNYCRNPDNGAQGPWCFTMDPSVQWDYCGVPYCECKTNRIGKNYGGTATTTKSGKTCQRWDSQTPHKHSRNDVKNFPEQRLSDAVNYCRNPDSEPDGPWCYTTDNNTRWEYCTVPPCECKETKEARTYMGTKSVTRSGKTCQRWDSQTPHKHTRNNPNNFPERNTSQARNYCRNPDGEPEPWCYTTDPSSRWEFCDVTPCYFYKPIGPTAPPKLGLTKGCKYDQLGKEYKGTISWTRSNITCQYWVSHKPHWHANNDPAKFPDRSLVDAENYCRNPDGGVEGPWCYTTDPNIRFEYCDVPLCDCKDDEVGKEYIGLRTTTKSGKTCQRWDSQTPHSHTRNRPEDFPEHSVSGANNYCRNPDDHPDGPWCYTTDPNTRWEICDIKKCDCKMEQMGRNYSGQINETMNKIPCQRWDQQYPHKHGKNPENYPEKNLTLAKNYCRNPDNEPEGPWCYTLDTNVRWAYCDVPYCKTAKQPDRPVIQPRNTLDSCKRNILGLDYNGNMSYTSTGRLCQRWDSQTPHNHQETDVSKIPDRRLKDAANHCRNPDASPLGPWCFTTDPASRWEYCPVPECDCKLTEKGKEYLGNISVTENGYSCQRWDMMTPHKHVVYKNSDFPDGSVAAANNYCRNPTSSEEPDGPWCFTTNPDVAWEYCGILDCDCKKTEKGENYTGRTDFTRSGRLCQRWDSQTPHSHGNDKYAKFPDKSLAEASNYCRNPDGEIKGPWCYTMDKAVRWEFCQIQMCPSVSIPFPSPSPTSLASKSGKLRPGGIAGITLSLIVLLSSVLLVLLVLFLRRRQANPGVPNLGISNPGYEKSSVA